MDVDRNEVLSMRVYPSRNILTTKQFIHEVLNYCIGKYFVDDAPWLKQALEELGLTYNIESLPSDRSLIESYIIIQKEQRHSSTT